MALTTRIFWLWPQLFSKMSLLGLISQAPLSDAMHFQTVLTLVLQSCRLMRNLSSASFSSSLLPITSSASAMGTFVKSEVTSKLTRILPSSSLMLLAFSTKSPESLTNVEVLPESGEMMRVRNLAKLCVGESMSWSMDSTSGLPPKQFR